MWGFADSSTDLSALGCASAGGGGGGLSTRNAPVEGQRQSQRQSPACAHATPVHLPMPVPVPVPVPVSVPLPLTPPTPAPAHAPARQFSLGHWALATSPLVHCRGKCRSNTTTRTEPDRVIAPPKYDREALEASRFICMRLSPHQVFAEMKSSGHGRRCQSRAGAYLR